MYHMDFCIRHSCVLYGSFDVLYGSFDVLYGSFADRNMAMGWLRLVGSLKLQVSFAKEPYKKDDILQKRLIILRSLLIVATPYGYSAENNRALLRMTMWLSHESLM